MVDATVAGGNGGNVNRRSQVHFTDGSLLFYCRWCVASRAVGGADRYSPTPLHGRKCKEFLIGTLYVSRSDSHATATWVTDRHSETAGGSVLQALHKTPTEQGCAQKCTCIPYKAHRREQGVRKRCV